MPRTKDYTDQVINDYKFIQPSKDRYRGQVMWLVECIRCNKYYYASKAAITHGWFNRCSCRPRYENTDGVIIYEDDLVKVTSFNSKRLSNDTSYLAAWNIIRDQIREGAKTRGLRFDLTIVDVESICKLNCHYCDLPPSNKRTKKHRQGGREYQITYSGIDRVDSSMGYEAGNIVPCCKYCNWAKNKQTTEEFEEWITRVYFHSFHIKK